MDLHVLGCPEHDLTIFGKCLCLCVCDKNFVASVARELMHGFSWNFIFRFTLTKIGTYQLLEEIAQQMAL